MKRFSNPHWPEVAFALTLFSIGVAARAEDGATSVSGGSDTEKGRRYVVTKGDSLWGIAQMLYDDGFKWKDIHEANAKSVSNPNLIYPQQGLILPPGAGAKSKPAGKPKELAAEAAASPKKKTERTLESKPETQAAAVTMPESASAQPPETRSSAAEPAAAAFESGSAAVAQSPAESTAGAVVKEPVAPADEVASEAAAEPEGSDAPAVSEPKKEFVDYDGKISSSRNTEQVMFSQGDKVFVDIGAKHGLAPGEVLQIVRKLRQTMDPVTRKKYWMVQDLGRMRVTDELFEDRAECKIIFSHDVVGIGDGVVRTASSIRR